MREIFARCTRQKDIIICFEVFKKALWTCVFLAFDSMLYVHMFCFLFVSFFFGVRGGGCFWLGFLGCCFLAFKGFLCFIAINKSSLRFLRRYSCLRISRSKSSQSNYYVDVVIISCFKKSLIFFYRLWKKNGLWTLCKSSCFFDWQTHLPNIILGNLFICITECK